MKRAGPTAKPKQDVAFHLNEALGNTTVNQIGNKTVEQKIPFEHNFMMAPLGSQMIYILSQGEENGHGKFYLNTNIQVKILLS
jgi:hypothetical protein